MNTSRAHTQLLFCTSFSLLITNHTKMSAEFLPNQITVDNSINTGLDKNLEKYFEICLSVLISTIHTYRIKLIREIHICFTASNIFRQKIFKMSAHFPHKTIQDSKMLLVPNKHLLWPTVSTKLNVLLSIHNYVNTLYSHEMIKNI